jgi:hypothetical protein
VFTELEEDHLAVELANYWSASAHGDNPIPLRGIDFSNGVLLGVRKTFIQRTW